MIIACDVDSVIIDLEEWIRRYNRDYDDDLSQAKIDRWATHELVKPECGHKIYDYLRDPDLYDHCTAVPGAIEGVTTLRERGHRVIFLTSGLHMGKFEWLSRNGLVKGNVSNEKDYVTMSDKTFFAPFFDLLIDDRAETVSNWPGKTILFDQPWNKRLEHPLRAYSWGDVISFTDYVDEILQCEGYHAKLQRPKTPHPTETSCPQQTALFRQIIEQAYQVHLDKNQDYSPANILGPGEIGLATRVWDKVTRLMNLIGFKVTAEFKDYTKPHIPRNESLDDNLLDLMVYSIIWQIYRKGKWGK